MLWRKKRYVSCTTITAKLRYVGSHFSSLVYIVGMEADSRRCISFPTEFFAFLRSCWNWQPVDLCHPLSFVLGFDRSNLHNKAWFDSCRRGCSLLPLWNCRRILVCEIVPSDEWKAVGAMCAPRCDSLSWTVRGCIHVGKLCRSRPWLDECLAVHRDSYGDGSLRALVLSSHDLRRHPRQELRRR